MHDAGERIVAIERSLRDRLDAASVEAFDQDIATKPNHFK
jgi:hypothetical protein